jgi:hypothetical protein
MTIDRSIRKVDTTEDGDVVCRESFFVSTIAEAREVNDELIGQRGYSCEFIVWHGKGGRLVYEREYVVDGAEVAIEEQNDRWAQRQTALDEQEYGRFGLFG